MLPRLRHSATEARYLAFLAALPGAGFTGGKPHDEVVGVGVAGRRLDLLAELLVDRLMGGVCDVVAMVPENSTGSWATMAIVLRSSARE